MLPYSAEHLVDLVLHCYLTSGRELAIGMIDMYMKDQQAWEERQSTVHSRKSTKHTEEDVMPIVQFGERDLLRGTVVEPAWYVVRIDSIGEAPSKDQQSINYPVEGTIIKNADNGVTEKCAGVPLDWNFNSKAIGFAVGFLKAFGVDVTAGQRFELKNAENKYVEVFIENDTWQGRMVNRVNHKYRPVGDGNSPA